MGAIDAVHPEARSVLFEVLLRMAWADGTLADDEVRAARGAAVALGLELGRELGDDAFDRSPESLGELPLHALSLRDRELTYLCASWMALADRVEVPAETALLRSLRGQLGLSETQATALHARATELREASPPSSSWWREFETLIVSAARVLQKGRV